jgi:hypothetical protein
MSEHIAPQGMTASKWWLRRLDFVESLKESKSFIPMSLGHFNLAQAMN